MAWTPAWSLAEAGKTGRKPQRSPWPQPGWERFHRVAASLVGHRRAVRNSSAGVPGRAGSAIAGSDFATRGSETPGFHEVVACVPGGSWVRRWSRLGDRRWVATFDKDRACVTGHAGADYATAGTEEDTPFFELRQGLPSSD